MKYNFVIKQKQNKDKKEYKLEQSLVMKDF